jgi:hypothetical protein
MKTTSHSAMLALVVFLAGQVLAQTPTRQMPSADDADVNQWEFSLATSGYLVPDDQSYGSPIFTADHQWLHLEARYNEEYLQTGSLWAGYNVSAGHKLIFEATPMFGVVFGSTTGVAPGYELSLTYKRVELSAQGEYIFNTDDRTASYFYTWNYLERTGLLADGLVPRRSRVPTDQRVPHQPRRAAWILSRSCAQESGFHDLYIRCRLDQPHGGPRPYS